MDQQRACTGPEQQIFGPPLNGLEHLSNKQRWELIRHRPAQAMITHLHASNPLTLTVGRHPSTGRFNFWQFRHSGHAPGFP
jgi:hypothetical protein